MKKLLSVVFAAVLLIVSLGLSGCGSQSSAPAPAKEESLADILGKGKNVAGYSFDYVMTHGGDKEQLAGKMWISTGKKMKSEMTMQNKKMISIIDFENKVMYACDPQSNSAFKMKFDPAKTGDVPERYTKDIDAAKAKVLETVVYEGVKCRVIQYKHEQMNVETKMWVREDYGLPMKVEITNSDGGKSVIEYKNMKFGPIGDDVFQLPPGTKIADMGELNIPQAGE